MDKLKKVLDPLTCALVIAAALLLFFLFQTRGLMEERAGRDAEPAKTVIAFLDSYTSASGTTERERVIEQYIEGASGEEKDHDGVCPTFIKFDAVFRLGAKPATYRVCSSQRNYIEIMLLDEDGSDAPCRIALYYRLSSVDKISSYTVARLLPVLKSDNEWRREWQ